MKTLAVVLCLLTFGQNWGYTVMQYRPDPAPVQEQSSGNNQAIVTGAVIGLAVTGLLVALHVRKVHKARAARFNIYLAMGGK